ncbi:hypothetical protein NP493_2144g00000 [Ridgeia piscesae]|uniref:Galaxin-like repeats domain-containing protein n=1 Tax=Ridgeia piscesae TaxID=27915 RepID=A0AAD9JLM8_RIDPI|nr:hypothetical protein NP493_2144g00000 [Ridgeia piscesae]
MKSALVLLVFVVAVALPCDAWLFGKLQCGDDMYDPRTHACCNDKLHLWPRDRVNTRCCKQEIYVVTTHHCCGNRSGEVQVVPVEPDTPGRVTCSKIMMKLLVG